MKKETTVNELLKIIRTQAERIDELYDALSQFETESINAYTRFWDKADEIFADINQRLLRLERPPQVMAERPVYLH
jgi:hypothetical protein